MITTRTHNELEDVLLYPKAPGVREPYLVIHGNNQNITVLNPGKNGDEYNKTYGHFHKWQGVETYTCLYGQGLLIMQRNDENGEAKEFKVVTLTKGKQVEVPAGFGHALVNISKEYLVALDNTPNNTAHNYDPVKLKRGFAYYIVEKKGEIAFDQNRNYAVRTQITSE